MGHQATIVILCDALHDIENDKDFGKKLVTAIKRHRPGLTARFNSGRGNAGAVIDLHHADRTHTVETGGNTGKVIAPYRIKIKTP